ncbi:MAG: ChaN family lipoprotein [Rhodobacteraceae bacterium]|nr:ChaN family lipoprotein [Paracoccaceae bacterium]
MTHSFFRTQGRAVALVAALFVAPLSVWTGTAGAEEIGADALDALPPADIVLLGEVHDNAIHHRNQARALEALAPPAVVFEMLSPEQAEFVNGMHARGPSLGDALGWDDSGWPDFALYLPVFEALGEAKVYGMAVPRSEANEAFGRPPAEVFGEGAGRYGLDQPLDETQQAAREAHQLAVHCDALPEDMLGGMVAAQRLRDAEFARTTLNALEETGGPVAVITGTGHVRRDWGMPVPLAAAAPDVSVLAVGQLEQTAPDDPPDDPPYDLWLVTEPAEREDPCLAFREPG